jgi:hypothetical protein
MYFAVKLVNRETGFDYNEGPVKVLVRVGRDILRDGMGTVNHLGFGVWEYDADESEIGPWMTLMVFTAPVAITEVRWHEPHPGQVVPVNLSGRESMSRTEFLGITVGMTPRSDCEFWLAQLLQADPIPLTCPIKIGLARAYPKLFK